MLRLIVLVLISSVKSIVYEKCINANQMSMTFDDGPTANTIGIMNILNKNNISGTFFINGFNVLKNNYSDVIKKMYKDGHIIGTHTYSHPALTKLNDFNVERELYDNELVIRNLIKMRPLLFRPPYFDYDDRIMDIIDKFGYNLIVANLDSLDWKNSSDILNVYKSKLKSGEGFISLNHDNIDENVNILDDVIKYTRSIGFEIVSMSECLGTNILYTKDNYYSPNLLG